MPAMPKTYSDDLIELIKAMLNLAPEKRPSVARILRNPFIKKHIAIFLEGTRSRCVSNDLHMGARVKLTVLQWLDYPTVCTSHPSCGDKVR